jgi:hypothetical protein
MINLSQNSTVRIVWSWLCCFRPPR